MTPDQRREFLASRGWSVARLSFRSGNRMLYSMTESPIRPDQQRGPLFFIDLESGIWSQSGHPCKEWELGPWHELVEEDASAPNTAAIQSGPVVIAPEFAPDGRKVQRMYPDENLAWFSECVEAGFEIVQQAPRLLDGYRDLGNREAKHNGVEYLLLCRTKTIMGPNCRKFTLADFINSTPKRTQQNVQQTASKVAEKPKGPVRFYQSTDPIEHSGAKKQQGMFA